MNISQYLSVQKIREGVERHGALRDSQATKRSDVYRYSCLYQRSTIVLEI